MKSHFVLACVLAAHVLGASTWSLYVSNERDGTVSVIDPQSGEVTRTITVGKRPRGVQVTPDGRTLLVAVSGSPRMGPGVDPQRALNEKPDKSADGIAVVDIAEG